MTGGTEGTIQEGAREGTMIGMTGGTMIVKTHETRIDERMAIVETVPENPTQN